MSPVSGNTVQSTSLVYKLTFSNHGGGLKTTDQIILKWDGLTRGILSSSIPLIKFVNFTTTYYSFYNVYSLQPVSPISSTADFDIILDSSVPISTEVFTTQYGFSWVAINKDRETVRKLNSVNKLSLVGIADIDPLTRFFYQVQGYTNAGSQADVLIQFQAPKLKQGGFMEILLDGTYFKASPGYIGQFCRVFKGIVSSSTLPLQCYKKR